VSDPDRPHGIELVHFLTDGAGPADGTVGFRHRAWYVGSDMRDLARAGRLDYVPMSLAAVPSLLSAGLLSFDVAFVQVAPPDDDGICSLGVSVDVTRAAALSAGRIIAEVNPNMPCTGPIAPSSAGSGTPRLGSCRGGSDSHPRRRRWTAQTG